MVDQLKEALQDPARREALERVLVHGLGWLPKTFPGFTELWEVLNLRNRQRLIRMLVEEVVVEEAEGLLRIRLRDFERLHDERSEVSA